MVVLRQEQNNGYAIPAVDTQLWDQFAIPRTLDEAQIDFPRIRLSDSVDQRALFNAIAAPDAAEDEDLHFPDEAAYQLALGIGQFRSSVDLIPPAFLLISTGSKVFVVGKPGHKSI